MKLVEQDRQILWWYTTAVVGHAYGHLIIVLYCRQKNASSIRCVLNCILDYVGQHTTKLLRIRADWRKFRMGLESQIVASLFSRACFGFNYSGDHFLHVNSFMRDAQHTTFD